LVDVLIAAPSEQTPRIQECHILIGHALCDAVEQAVVTAECEAIVTAANAGRGREPKLTVGGRLRSIQRHSSARKRIRRQEPA